VAVAGHCDEHRPHSVQLNMSSTCFQVNWSMCEAPKVVAFSRSCLESAPSGSSFWKKTLGSEVMTWKCLASGRKFSMTSTERLCAHHATAPTVATKPRLIPASHGRTTWFESGSQKPSPAIAGSLACSTSRLAS